MANLTASLWADMTTWDLHAIAQGTIGTATETAWTVTSGDNAFAFSGANLHYGSGMPTGGMIRGFSQSIGGSTTFTLTGSISAEHLANYLATNDLTGLQNEWFHGDDNLNGSQFNDHLLGYSGNDTFDLASGGSDTVDGGKGDDTFRMGDALGTTDRIDGGRGHDTVTLNASYVITFNATMMKGVETIRLAARNDYIITLDHQNIGSGGMTVDGSALKAGDSLDLTLSSGNKMLEALGGAGADTLHGAAGSDGFSGNGGADVLWGAGGADWLSGGAGHDRFVYGNATDSNGGAYDTIADFDTRADTIGLGFAVNHVHHPVAGNLTAAGFDSDLALGLNGVLGKHDAALFTANAGDMSGETFLVIDANNVAGYQAGQDLVIHLADLTHAGDLGVEDFLLNG